MKIFKCANFICRYNKKYTSHITFDKYDVCVLQKCKRYIYKYNKTAFFVNFDFVGHKFHVKRIVP